MLSCELDDIDLVQYGLMLPPPQPIWSAQALQRIVASERVPELLANCNATHQVGLLEAALRRCGLWSNVAQALRAEMEDENHLVDTVRIVLFTYAQYIHTICTELGLRYSFLKGLTTSHLLYSTGIERPFKDIDIILSRSDGNALRGALTALGFFTAEFHGNELKRVETGTTLSRNGYELPPLWMEVPVETDWDFKSYFRRRSSTRAFVAGDTLYVRVPVEIHYALSEQLTIDWRPQAIPDLADGSFNALGKTEQLLYHIFKGYIDVTVWRRRFGIKLISDAMRQMTIADSAVDLEYLLELAKSNRVLSMLWYVASRIADKNNEQTLAARINSMAAAKNREPLDFGDFIIPSLRSMRLMVLTSENPVERERVSFPYAGGAL